MQSHYHRWPSTWIPSGSSQDLKGSSHSLIWPHYVTPNCVLKKPQNNTTWGCVQEFPVLWMCKVFLECGKASFFSGFTASFHVFRWVFFLSISTPAQSTGGWRGTDCIPASLSAGTSFPAGLRHGTGRSLGSRNWINSGNLQQQLHQLSDELAPPCTGCSIFQPNPQEKVHEQIYHKTVFFVVQKKNMNHILVSCSQGLHTGAEAVSSYHAINHIPSCKICFQENRNTDNLPANDLDLHIFSSNKS